MMLNLLNRQKIELAGLDIGTAAVKLVHLTKTAGKYTLVSAVAESVAPCADDTDQQRQHCLKAVKTCLQKADFRNKSIVCGVSGPEVVVRGFTFPPIPDTAVEQAVRMEAQQVCPLDISQSVLDYQLIETAEDEKPAGPSKAQPRRGVIAVGTKQIIQQRSDLLTEAGAKAVMVDVNALAMLNCLNELQLLDARETAAVIDIGSTLTNVVIYGSDGLPFVRDINKAGLDIIQQVSRELNRPDTDVLQMFTQAQAGGQLDDRVLLALNNAIAPLANAVNETLRFYSFQEKQSRVDRIFLCGGFALIETLVEFLTDAMSVPVELLNPFMHMPCESSSNEQQALIKNGPVYATAAGLAMRTL